MPPKKKKRSSSFSEDSVAIVPTEVYAVAAAGRTAQILKPQGLRVFPQSWTVETTPRDSVRNNFRNAHVDGWG